MKRLLHLGIQSVLWLGAWLIFTGKFTSAELAVGAVCSVGAAFALLLLYR